jgi:alkanesulfonate monooxygenase SsuD/methylene tetrahydromethanopterin reductase-like flavin-dependent oxidoreductase (luciferase family)
VLREYLEAMRALWTQEEASYDGEFVSFGASWAYPKPVQGHLPVLIGAGGTEKNFAWLVEHADGWITTPRDVDIDDQVVQLRELWAAAGRSGQPEVVTIAVKPDPVRIAQLESIGVTECAFGLPDKSEEEVVAYLGRLRARLDA